MIKMKKNGLPVFALLIAVILFITSCGKSNALATLPPPPDVAGPGIAQTTATAGQTAGSETPSAAPDALTDMTITWGYGNYMYYSAGDTTWSDLYKLDDRAVNLANELGSRFGVTINPASWTNSSYYNTSVFSMANMPDVSVIHADKQAILDSGATRTIPMDMIKKYAPNYAAALEKCDPNYLSYFNSDDGARLIALPSYNGWSGLAQTFPVYRLDWLEQLGITPHGNMTQVANRVYFADQPFTQDEFADIMKKFAQIVPSGAAKTYGMAMENVVGINQTDNSNYLTGTIVSSLYGMWGLSLTSTDVDGKFSYTGDTDAYRSMLEFIQDLAANGAILSTNDPEANFRIGVVGWKNSQVAAAFSSMFNGLELQLLSLKSDAKLLITPPEVGNTGQSGVTVWSDYPFNGDMLYVNSKVSDEKLAVILQIFEALSYEPDLWLESNYGKEGTDWKWTGTPYESAITTIKNGTTFFRTGVNDSMLGDYTFNANLDPVIAEYIKNNGARLAIKPTDPSSYGATNDMWDAFNAYDPDRSKQTAFLKQVSVYMADVAAGNKDVNSTWSDYIQGIDDMYLTQYYKILGLR